MSLHLSQRDLCRGYLHVDACWEFGQERVCLGASPCQRKPRALAWLTNPAGETEFLRDYVHTYRGSVARNQHPEDLLLEDAEFLAALDRAHDGHLTWYSTYQPCFHSGRLKNSSEVHPKDCARKLAAFHCSDLWPRAIALDIKIFGLYRVHWQPEHMRDSIKSSLTGCVQRANFGLRILFQIPGLELDVMTDADWARFRNLFVPSCRRLIDHGREARRSYEDKCRAFIEDEYLQHVHGQGFAPAEARQFPALQVVQEPQRRLAPWPHSLDRAQSLGNSHAELRQQVGHDQRRPAADALVAVHEHDPAQQPLHAHEADDRVEVAQRRAPVVVGQVRQRQHFDAGPS